MRGLVRWFRRWLRAYAPAIAAGAWIALGAPPQDWFLAVPSGLTFLALLLERTRHQRWQRTAGIGFVFGTTVNVVALRFVPEVIVHFTPLPWALGALALVLVAMLQSLAFTFTALVTRWLRRLAVPLPIAFAFGHLVGTHAPAVFPWTVAAGLAHYPWTVQSASLWGEPGAATLWALLAGMLASMLLALRRGRKRRALVLLAATSLAIFGICMHGTLTEDRVRAAREEAPALRVGLVHPSYAATMRWDPGARERLSRILHEQTRLAERRGVALTVWPESAHPYPFAAASRRDAAPPRSVLGPGVRGPVMAGVLRRHNATDETNSVILVEPDGTFGAPYDKLHLLAFGEHVPFAEQIPWLKRTFARGIGMVPGTHSVLQMHNSLRAGIQICFEDTLPSISREMYEAGTPNLIVNVTNDAWFTGTTEPTLHLRLATLRSLETQLDMVRSVNGGTSAHIAATGAVLAREDSAAPALLIATPRLLEHPPTLYVRYGEAPAWLALLVLALITRPLRHVL